MDLCELLFEFGKAEVSLKRARRLAEQAEARLADAGPEHVLALDAGLGLALARLIRAEARAETARARMSEAGYTAAA